MSKPGPKPTILKKGQRFGKMTLIREVKTHVTPSGVKVRMFRLQCDCGNKTKTNLSALKKGSTQSCGCLKLEAVRENIKKASAANIKHDLSRHPIYKVWCSMIERCHNPKHPAYKDYGSRGIQVCKRWRENNSDFFDWAMTNGYAQGLDLDRKNNDGNYTPRNCRFVTRKVNQNNRRNTAKARYKGRDMTLREIYEIAPAVVSYSTFFMRIRRYGWSVKKAIGTPVK